MGIPLRLLIVGDSEDDTVLLIHELKRGGYDPVFERVDTPEAMSAALDKETFDMVISGYVMPRFSGLGALKILQEKGLDLPFILISGKISDDEAVEALKAGAYDFISRNNMARLVPAVERELREAKVRWERKLVEQQVREKVHFLQVLIDAMPMPIYYEDVEGTLMGCNTAFATAFGLPKDEVAGKSVHEIFPRNLAVKLKEMDLALPGQSGVQVFEHQVRFADGSKRDVVLHKATYEDAAGCLAGSVGVLIDITERKRAELKSEKSLKKLRKAVEGAVHALVTTVEIKDPYTFGHQQRVSKLAYAIGREMGLSAKIIEGIRLAGLVHDLGKIYVPSEILSKPSKLNSLEFSFVKTHPQVGYDILKRAEFFWPIAQIVFQHHERLDGSGYPSGLTGNAILIEAKIMAVADVVEAITSHRPYRPSLGIDMALKEISRNKGVLYDPDAVDACLRLFKKKGFKL